MSCAECGTPGCGRDEIAELKKDVTLLKDALNRAARACGMVVGPCYTLDLEEELIEAFKDEEGKDE